MSSYHLRDITDIDLYLYLQEIWHYVPVINFNNSFNAHDLNSVMDFYESYSEWESDNQNVLLLADPSIMECNTFILEPDGNFPGIRLRDTMEFKVATVCEYTSRNDHIVLTTRQAILNKHEAITTKESLTYKDPRRTIKVVWI